MGRINELFCDYLGRAENYADFWNGTQFHGVSKLKSDFLTRHDREYHKSQHKPVPLAGIQRDLLMQYCEEEAFILGLEIMETLDYSIPVRVMDYNAQELQRQIKDKRLKQELPVEEGQEKKRKAGEFLYGVKRQDEFIPVHTIALYCGMDDYDGKESILEMTNYHRLPPEFQAMFVDYSIQVYQLKNLQEEYFQTSLREIIAVFKRSRDRAAVKEYYQKNKQRFAQMDELSVDVMGALIGKNKLKFFKQEDGGVDMCKAFEDEREEGREEGIRQSVVNLMRNLKWTSQQALEALGIPRNEWEKYQQV